MENITYFFNSDNTGNSHPVEKVILNNTVGLKASYIKARNTINVNPSGGSVAIDGIPGIPFEAGTPNPDVFYQGEDIIYDLFLTYNNQPVNISNYDIRVGVKTSTRAVKFIFEAVLDQGLYPIPQETGYFELWLPGSITSELLAGSYYLDVLLADKLGQGGSYGDRKNVLLRTMFNLEYSVHSPNPENTSQSFVTAKRSTLEPTWPNKPNTIGLGRLAPNSVYPN